MVATKYVFTTPKDNGWEIQKVFAFTVEGDKVSLEQIEGDKPEEKEVLAALRWLGILFPKYRHLAANQAMRFAGLAQVNLRLIGIRGDRFNFEATDRFGRHAEFVSINRKGVWLSSGDSQMQLAMLYIASGHLKWWQIRRKRFLFAEADKILKKDLEGVLVDYVGTQSTK